MPFDLGTFLGSNIGQAFKDIMGVFKVDPTVALEKRSELEALQMQLQGKILDQVTAQLEVNKAEAASTSTFVAGWRPAVGWICGFALASQFIIGPLLTWASTLLGHPVTWPVANNSDMMTVLLGMLGIGGMRTYEKIQGVPGTSNLH
jgi:hypothetical protein